MNAAKFPVLRDLARFDFNCSQVDQSLVRQLATLTFTDTVQNACSSVAQVPGKMHLATVVAVSGIAARGRRVRVYSPVDLVYVLEREKREGKAGRTALSLMRMDLFILGELGYLPLARSAESCCSICYRSCTSIPA